MNWIILLYIYLFVLYERNTRNNEQFNKKKIQVRKFLSWIFDVLKNCFQRSNEILFSVCSGVRRMRSGPPIVSLQYCCSSACKVNQFHSDLLFARGVFTFKIFLQLELSSHVSNIWRKFICRIYEWITQSDTYRSPHYLIEIFENRRLPCHFSMTLCAIEQTKIFDQKKNVLWWRMQANWKKKVEENKTCSENLFWTFFSWRVIKYILS